MEIEILISIILYVMLLINIFGFLLFYNNKIRKKSGTLIPSLIMIECLNQSILNYTLIICSNEKFYFENNPLSIILNSMKIYNSFPSYFQITIKSINSILFISCTILGIIIEILYCIESFLLFHNPVSSTKFRKPFYIFILILSEIIFLFLIIKKKFKEDFTTYNIFKKEFWTMFHSNLTKIYYVHEQFIQINIEMIKEYIIIIIIIYFFISFLSIISIFFNINRKSVLFLKEKKIFHKKHLIYVSISFIILITFLFLLNSNQGIILSLSSFGTFGCLIRIFELDFFNRSKSKNNDKEELNEHAIKEFSRLSNTLKSHINEINEYLIENENENIQKKIIDDSYINNLINSKNNEKDNNTSILNNPPLSTQISLNFISESVFYIVMCILNTAELNENSSNKNISLIMNSTDKKYSNIQEHVVKIKNNKFQGIETKKSYQFNELKFSIFDNKNDIKIYEYAPDIFNNILKADKISYNQIMESFNLESNIINLSKLTKSEGQSGSIFFHTHDKKFIIKTISHSELKAMINNLLLNYYKLLTENNFSILSRIYGLYTLRMGISVVHMVLMENIFPYESDFVLYKFDLKGSFLGRKTKKLFEKKDATLKDIDYCELSNNRSDIKLSFLKNDIITIKKSIHNDLKILEKGNLMDYSFFICICRNENIDNNKLLIKQRMFKSKNKEIVYLLGIIDYLTEYNKKKILENVIKNIFHKKDSFSCVSPTKYKKRFEIFIKAVLKGEDNLFNLLKDLNSGKEIK